MDDIICDLNTLKSIMPETRIGERKKILKGWGIDGIGETCVYDRVHNGSEDFRAETVKLLHFSKGKKCSLHSHREKFEIFYIVYGSFLLRIVGKFPDNKSNCEFLVVLKKGDSISIPQNLEHQMQGLEEENILLEVSTQDKPEDSYRTEKGD